MGKSAHLPPEILESIFLRCTAPLFLLDLQSLRTDSKSAWFQDINTKLTLVNVCRSWRDVAIPLLYEHIKFRRLSQILALLRAIDAIPERREHVKGIYFQIFIFPESHYSSLLNQYVEDVVTKCPSLRALTVHALLPLSVGADLTVWPPITHLSLCLLASPYSDPLHLLRLTQHTLVSLSLDLTANLEFCECQSIHLPNLTELFLNIKLPDLFSDNHIPLVLNTLRVPSMRVFSCDVTYSSKFTCDPANALASFLKAHHSVHSIFLAGQWNADQVLSILKQCPNLEHLALNPFHHLRLNSISHPNVRWIDFATQMSTSGEVLPIDNYLDQQNLPNLQTVREVNVPTVLFLPIVKSLPPNKVASEGGQFEMNFPGINISHSLDYVHSSVFINSADYDEDSGSDSDYEYEDEDSESSTESEISV